MEAAQEVPSRDQSGTHLKGNSSGHLNIKKRKATFVEMLNEVKEGSFGGIRDSVKHGLTREISANGDAVNATDKFVLLPKFEAVGVACVVQVCVGGNELWRNPGGTTVRGGACAFSDHTSEGPIGCDLKRLFSEESQKAALTIKGVIRLQATTQRKTRSFFRRPSPNSRRRIASSWNSCFPRAVASLRMTLATLFA